MDALRLEAVGLRAINNVVEVTNFVMMELGQPLHAFDFRFLNEGRIVVRRSQEGEPFVSLDGKTRNLNAETLMICDGRGQTCGHCRHHGRREFRGEDDTDAVLLESAYFNPSTIRRGAKFLGMGTDAAFRFERGIDPEGVVRALDRAAQLIADLSGGTVCKGHIDTYPGKVDVSGPITLRMKRVGEILGTEVKASEAAAILKGLEMTVKKEGKGVLSVIPPTFRVDLWREIDLIEEIARLHGYDRIPLAAEAFLVWITLENVEISLKLAEETEGQLKESYDKTLEGWAKALEYRDRETEGHSRRVTNLCTLLALQLGIKDEDLLQLHRGALLHDIGKMAIPDSILFKPGPLNDSEWELMRMHPVYAKEMLEDIPYLKNAITIPYCHHERWDGKAYPQGLRGEEIPLPSRIFTVVDHWEALNSDRPYRKAVPKEQVLDYIRDNSGIIYDPLIADIFLGLMDERVSSEESMEKALARD